jgi:hypothetical protein
MSIVCVMPMLARSCGESPPAGDLTRRLETLAGAGDDRAPRPPDLPGA